MTPSGAHSTELPVPGGSRRPAGGGGSVRQDGLSDLLARMLAQPARTGGHDHGDGRFGDRRRGRQEDER
jgi:hypothetical protein